MAILLKTLSTGLIYDGQDTPRTELLADARTRLVMAGRHQLDVDDSLVDEPGRVVRAWWGGDDIGFVGQEHPQARPVTAVNLPRGLTGVSAPGTLPATEIQP